MSVRTVRTVRQFCSRCSPQSQHHIQFPTETFFSSPNRPDRPTKTPPSPPPVSGCRVLCPRVKQRERKADHSKSSFAVESEWSHTSAPLVCLYTVNRDSFTFTFTTYTAIRALVRFQSVVVKVGEGVTGLKLHRSRAVRVSGDDCTMKGQPVRILIVRACTPDYAATSSGVYLHASNPVDFPKHTLFC